MKKLQEILTIGRPRILHEGKTKDGDTMTILAPFTQAGEKNQNGRIYPMALMKREVERVQSKVESGAFIGSGDHNPSGHASIGDASHIVQKLWMDEEGKGWAELKILPTTKGKNVMTIIRNGGQLGLSTRGMGSVLRDGKVADDYKLFGIDIVTNPSYQGGVFNQANIHESADFEPKKAPRQMSEKVLGKLFSEMYDAEKRMLGYAGTFEEWKAKREKTIRARLLVGRDGITSVEEALNILEDPADKEARRKQENKVCRLTASQIFAEARIAGVDPNAFAAKINAKIQEEEDRKGSGYSIKERQDIYEAARRAGVDISTAEGRKLAVEKFGDYIGDEFEIIEAEARAFYEVYKKENPNVSLQSCRRMILKEREAKAAEKRRIARINSLVRENMLAGGKPIRRREN